MRILIVEDEPKIVTFLKSALEAEYFAVDAVTDGEQGSYQARTNEYDLIVLDNNLPKKMGIDVCKDIRAAGKTIPIIILSVKTDASQKIDMLNAGADDYLTKPFTLEELVARIHALLRRPKTIKKESISVRDITLDSRTYKVIQGGKSIVLTRKEFMLLQYLMEHAGVVLSRSMLLEHVWDMSVDVFSNTIESHILSLRKKLGDVNRTKIIQTVSGRGYRFEA